MESYINLGLCFLLGLIAGLFVCRGFGRRQLIISFILLLWTPSFIIYEDFYNAPKSWWSWWPYWIVYSGAIMVFIWKLEQISKAFENFVNKKLIKSGKKWRLNKYKVNRHQIMQERVLVALCMVSISTVFIQMVLATGFEFYGYSVIHDFVEGAVLIMMVFLLAKPGVDLWASKIESKGKNNEEGRDLGSTHAHRSISGNNR
ncbi:hypothetical protein FLL45_01620 [Aliikangiella marina]|uniref:Uncharacterized protein n=1 Tax=Aliikangiella marina TaxID=1712262 RepID=A0A545THL8_9GAMM|nr:hypothetical protein [Aliikangiella marina]TQV76686.1 hypothetical protein FLL45_01620 [Aliikangiella marina]